MSSFDPAPDSSTPQTPTTVHTDAAGPTPTRVGTVVWGLIVMALAALIIIAHVVTLNGTYVLIGLMIGAGAALVIGGLLSARKRDNEPTTGKS
ncbi:hypothetical protein ACVWY0_000536 [Arthrobacter sp. UYNi723]